MSAFERWLADAGFDSAQLGGRYRNFLRRSFDAEKAGRRNHRTETAEAPVVVQASDDVQAAAEETDLLAFTAAVDFAAADYAKPDTPPPRTFAIHAYSGGPMALEGFYHPVVVDLAGVQPAANDLPVFLNHDETQIVGQGTPSVNSSGIKIEGRVTGSDGASKHVVDHVRGGFKWMASIGGKVTRREFVDAGKSATVNGKLVNGPAIIARGFTLKEVSMVPLGADTTTRVHLTASSKDSKMSSLNTSIQSGDAIIGERRRISEIRAICGEREDIAAMSIDQGLSAEQAELQLLRAEREKSEIKTLRESRDPRGGLPSPLYASASHLGGASEVDILQASMGFSCGLSESQVAESYGEQAADLAQSRKHKGAGLHAAMDLVLAAAGKARKGRVDSDYLRAVFEADRDLRAASSTISLEGILSNVQNKMMEQGYASVETVWPLFCSPKPTPDFKPNFFYRMTGFGAMQQVGPTGELKHIELTEQQFSATNDTWGAIIEIPRTMLTNDDMGAFGQMSPIFGRMAALSLEEQIFTLLMSNPEISGVNFFSSTNGNYSSGGGSALSTSSLATAVKLFRSQQDPNGKPILLSPRTLLVGQTNEQAAKVAIGSSDLIQTALQTITGAPAAGLGNLQGSANPFLRQLNVAVSPWLETAAIPGNSTTAFYLFGDPRAIAPIYVTFLNGAQLPTIQTAESDFSTLGLRMRAFFDYGVGVGDHRAAFQSAGA